VSERTTALFVIEAENRIITSVEALAGRENMRVHNVCARIQTHLVTKVNNVPTLP
jgi:hypothetical protein